MNKMSKTFDLETPVIIKGEAWLLPKNTQEAFEYLEMQRPTEFGAYGSDGVSFKMLLAGEEAVRHSSSAMGMLSSTELSNGLRVGYKAMRALDPAFKGGQTAAYTGHDRRERGWGFGSGMTQAHFDAFERAERRGKPAAEPAPAIKQYARVVTDERVIKDRRTYSPGRTLSWFQGDVKDRRAAYRRSDDQ